MYVLDTNVVSELRKVRAGKADARVAHWANNVNATELFLSIITIHELELGVLLAERRNAPQGAVLRAWLDNHVLPAFSGRILSIDTLIARCSAKFHVPHPRPLRDGLIAATALVHGMTVVTRNIADFEPTGVAVLNPWQMALGHTGDVEPVGQGVSELRIHYGPGYRVYFQQRGDMIVILLCGSDKDTQTKDIKLAKRLADEWSE